MLSPFLLYRAATFALFIVCNTVICSVAAWNLSFAQSSNHLATLAHIDSFLIFAGALGLLVVFPVIFIEVFRRGALSSRVWFEIAWLTLFWVFNFAGATGVTAVAPSKMCSPTSDNSHSSGSACSSSRVLIAFAWINTCFLFMYFFFLTVFSIMHQKEDASVWRSTVVEFPWFETKQCIRSAPNSPIMARFVKSKSPSLVVPKPRRVPPPPLFIHGRAGLGSRVEIEHFTDIASLEEQQSPPFVPVAAPPAAYSFYPQHVQATMQAAPTVYRSNSYNAADHGSTPPPIRDWPRLIGSSSTSNALGLEGPMTERAAQKQRAPAPVRSNSEVSSSSQKSGRMRAPPPPPLQLERTTTKDSLTQSSAQSSPSRSRPTGPRKRSGSSTFVRPRPPPLDLTRNGSTPNVRR
ncbi:uncharacterized protein FOMMEDRAFT_139172 [Fomitiporia mediterranea MF3/22]|uniref:uncharacterized protein n=1 Tax=Fomitiporia mediterranea (strain MF3/22) TaxID=694068 RepID=UPI0004408F4E|nr:uncharacterized protein FOMMEDRAFT_139172 [Fomitiporia mediterranea MF3/22]EJD05838.1 hypothetical protein FOMMEDRAFT_139172 [Fomitiporia mediterranea MF3/22]